MEPEVQVLDEHVENIVLKMCENPCFLNFVHIYNNGHYLDSAETVLSETLNQMHANEQCVDGHAFLDNPEAERRTAKVRCALEQLPNSTSSGNYRTEFDMRFVNLLMNDFMYSWTTGA